MNPHPVLGPWYHNLEEKQTFLRKIFDDSAPHYETIAKWGWFGSGDWYRVDVLKRHGLQPGMRVVDVASGTGPTARAVAKVVGDPSLVTCVEPSRGMLEESKKQLSCEHIQATAESIPLPDACCDYLTMGFALRRVDDLVNAFREYHRLLKPGGKVLILDVTRPENRFAYPVYRFYFKTVLPWFSKVLTGSDAAKKLMDYYWLTMDEMVSHETVLAALSEAGFENPQKEICLGVFSEYTANKKNS
jgi:demethylmenaquinone methyltransferase/2-methoxy-6-polyprenyl-1,4-benzoquinol methylase